MALHFSEPLWNTHEAAPYPYPKDALHRLIRYLLAHSPFYQRHLKSHTPEDALHQLPFTTKEDLQAHNLDFLCVHSRLVRDYVATSGTLGKPVTIALTRRDLYRLSWNERQSFHAIGARSGDVIQLMLTLDRQFMAGIAYYSGVRKLGAAAVRTGPGLPAMQWEVAQRLGTSMLVAVPSSLLQLAAYAREHSIDLDKQTIRGALCIGEPLRHADLSLNALGLAIRDAWPGLKLYGTYASTEMQTAFTECGDEHGALHQPNLVIVEIIDPETLKPLPDGQPGEVVISTLGVEGMPLLRYRTGDIAALLPSPSGSVFQPKRLGPVIGRLGQMIKYRGTTLFPPAIFDLLNEASDAVDAYVVEVFKNELGTDELRLHLHSPLSPDECSARLKPLFQSRLRVVPQAVYLTREAMQGAQFPPGARKVVKFIDRR